MAKGKSFFDRFRLVYRRSSPLLKCVVLATIVLCTAALIAIRVGILRYQDATDDLRAQAAELEREKKSLEVKIGQLGTVQSVKDIAREQLGYVDPDTIIFESVTNEN